MNNTINRLIIIGNGFDLAHGMKTKYKDFVNGYLRQRIESFDGENSEDLLIKIKYKGDAEKQSHRLLRDYRQYLKLKELKSRVDWLQPEEKILLDILYGKLHPHERAKSEFTEKEVQEILNDCTEEEENEIHLTQGIIQLIEEQGEYSVEYSPFFKKVYDEIEDKNWVDIECEYYKYLCGLMKKLDLSDEEDTKKEVSKEIDELNEEMKFITKKLVEYLNKEDGTFEENSRRVNNEILDKMMMPLSKQEIAVEALEQWDSFVKEKYSTMHGKDDKTEFSQCKKDNGELNIEWLMEKYPKELRPDEIVILNFNYTSLAAAYHTRIADNLKYKDKGTAYLNQIHGTLYGKEEIIFGYGDDSGEMYKRLSDKNDNRLLENDKTVKYLGSFWYRNFFGFIESAPFQVCIMGHSCGISDRTLLSTIFQHENCVSIKPYYYYDKEKNSDDYYEIIKNISRCFDDKKLMRDRVVNKDYCEPLPQPVEKKE